MSVETPVVGLMVKRFAGAWAVRSADAEERARARLRRQIGNAQRLSRRCSDRDAGQERARVRVDPNQRARGGRRWRGKRKRWQRRSPQPAQVVERQSGQARGAAGMTDEADCRVRLIDTTSDPSFCDVPSLCPPLPAVERNACRLRRSNANAPQKADHDCRRHQCAHQDSPVQRPIGIATELSAIDEPYTAFAKSPQAAAQ